MKKTLLAIALASTMMAGSAFATDPSVGFANSVTATYANAGNGGTSHSTASNYAGFTGVTNAVTSQGSLSANAANCNVPSAIATVTGTVTTVTGTATTFGGSSASNTSTGNGFGDAFAGGQSQSYVSRDLNGVSGWAQSNTGTVANVGTNETHSAFASQSASFTAKGVTGSIVVATPSTSAKVYQQVGTHTTYASWDCFHWFPQTTPVYGYVTVVTPGQTLFTGTGALSTGSSDVGASTQLYSLNNGGCGSNCSNGVGTANFTDWTGTGSFTNGQASTYTNITVSNQAE